MRNLVDFVEDEHGVRTAGFDKSFDDTSWHGAHIGFSVSAYLCLVVQASQRYSHVLAFHGSSDAFAEGGLAHTWRTVKADDGALEVTSFLKNGKVLEDSFLDFLHAVVVTVEHSFCVLDIEVVFGVFVPRNVEQGVEVVVLYAVVGSLRIETFQFVQFLDEDVVHLVRPFLGQPSGVEFLNIRVVTVAQFLLNVAHFLLQEIVALLFIDVLFGAHLYVGLEHGELELAVEDAEQFVGAFGEAVNAEQGETFGVLDGQ